MNLNLHYKQIGKQGQLELEGSFVVYSISKWKDCILEKIPEIETLKADFSKVNQIDSAGLQILISTKKLFISENKKFTIIKHSPKLIEYLDLYGLIRFFEDKISISSKEKEKYQFRYGLKKLPKFLKT